MGIGQGENGLDIGGLIQSASNYVAQHKVRRDLILAIGPGRNLTRDLILVRLGNHLLKVLFEIFSRVNIEVCRTA